MISWLIILGIINVIQIITNFKITETPFIYFSPVRKLQYSEEFYYESHTWISLAKQTNINVMWLQFIGKL